MVMGNCFGNLDNFFPGKGLRATPGQIIPAANASLDGLDLSKSSVYIAIASAILLMFLLWG